ncbi:hypothetical protein HX001_00805 [Empedobacter brevis]|uniref:DUF4468 domain-containing protein n=2 Tax=Empedobacter brevis TaxID=247 RepID=A0A511NC32_9FLAO|nr:hypothetical protein [Empedobacter brevis]MDM1071026.1 hypothetical protein [Empedobacter brevis]QES93397.1 hypothetical protein F0358_12075 [Empedobacter brevis]GEM50379.1 hypothetical protein EB1_01690 [Empedobacter brevis NBRC 14943 = ATCC 43319]
MYKSIFYLLLLLFSSFSFAQTQQSVVEWKKDFKLNYENFKKKPAQTKVPQGYLDSKLGWQIAEIDGEIPELKVFNRFDENNSWVSMKHTGILTEMQLQFDLSELYARKIRKDFDILRSKKVMDKDSYRAKFVLGSKNFQKRLKSIAGVSLNQPDLYKLLNKQIQDSLILYQTYLVN